MRIGPLRHRVTIQRLSDNSPSQDGGGVPDQAWTDVATVSASINPLRGRELLAAQAVSAETSGMIRIRYLSGVEPKMRAVFGEKIYDIVAVVNVEERNREMLLYVREVNAG